MLLAKTILLALISSCLHVMTSHAQYFSDTSYYKQPTSPPALIVKVDLLSFLDTYANLLIDVEYRIKPALYLQHGIGFVTGLNDYDFDSDEFINNPIGFKFRNELRFYLDFVNGSRKGYYLAPALLYGYVYGNEEEVVGINCEDGCDFFRLIDLKAIRQEAAIHFKIGSQRIYNEKISLDYFLGAGGKYEWFDISGLDLNSTDRVNEEDLQPEAGFRYGLTVGFKVGWVIK